MTRFYNICGTIVMHTELSTKQVTLSDLIDFVNDIERANDERHDINGNVGSSRYCNCTNNNSGCISNN